MYLKAKTMRSAAAVSLVAFTSVLHGVVDDAQVSTLDHRISTLEKTRGPNGLVNPPGRPQVKDGYDIFVDAELLWWSAYENGLQYAISVRDVVNRNPRLDADNSSPVMLGNSEVVDVGNNYTWGFRFGVGYNLPHDGWDLFANWTFFNNHTETTRHAPRGGVLAPTWFNPDDDLRPNSAYDAVALHANGKWNLELRMIDLELGREFFVSKYLTLHPHMGFRYVRIDQQLHVQYKQSTGSTSLMGESEKYLARYSNDMWGFGLRGGLDTQFGIGKGFSIYGNLAASILHSHFHVSQTEYTRNILSSARGTTLSVNNRKRVGRAITDLALGLRWDQMFDSDRYHLGIQLGWEHLMFWGQNQMWQFVNSAQPALHSNGNNELTTQGWTLAARFDF